jgi:hypothetical protein
MAERSLRSRGKTWATDSEIQELDNAQSDIFSQEVVEPVHKQHDGENLESLEIVETDEDLQVSVNVASHSDRQVRAQGEIGTFSSENITTEQVAPSQDLLTIIWKTMQGRDKREETRREADKIAMQKEKKQRLEKEIEREKREETRREADKLAMQERNKQVRRDLNLSAVG